MDVCRITPAVRYKAMQQKYKFDSVRLTTQLYIPEDKTLHNHRCANHKSCVNSVCLTTPMEVISNASTSLPRTVLQLVSFDQPS
jgi:hypothetical protein